MMMGLQMLLSTHNYHSTRIITWNKKFTQITVDEGQAKGIISNGVPFEG